MNKPLRGIIPPLVTPLSDNDKLDLEGLERLIEHTIMGGVNGIFILGTTGEFASLSYKLRCELIQHTCKIVKGRVPVLTGISDSSFSESLNLARCASHNGSDAVILTPPYYFTLEQPELLEYLKRITPQIPLPLFIYNIPVYTKVNFEPATVKEAASIPGITGMKDSSSNLAYFKQVQNELRDNKDFTFMVGQEEYMSEFVLTGGHGGINGGANLFPRLYVSLYNASVNHDFDTISRLQQKVMQINTTLYKVGHHDSSYLKGLKCALSLLGICNDFMAEPFQRFNKPERMIIKQILEDLNYRELL
jgi:dihydrodipicolinate synthase/N-acetylneuraminate lyase